ncbi:MAG: hypothetical protein CL926_13655 [Deltaproteobacteria bacterium]|nr:hypothetical protein [Deltaproteobacteria bacterium]
MFGILRRILFLIDILYHRKKILKNIKIENNIKSSSSQADSDCAAFGQYERERARMLSGNEDTIRLHSPASSHSPPSSFGAERVRPVP